MIIQSIDLVSGRSLSLRHSPEQKIQIVEIDAALNQCQTLLATTIRKGFAGNRVEITEWVLQQWMNDKSPWHEKAVQAITKLIIYLPTEVHPSTVHPIDHQDSFAHRAKILPSKFNVNYKCVGLSCISRLIFMPLYMYLFVVLKCLNGSWRLIWLWIRKRYIQFSRTIASTKTMTDAWATCSECCCPKLTAQRHCVFFKSSSPDQFISSFIP